MREKVVRGPVKVPHLTDAAARLLRAGNPHSMMNRKLIAAAQVIGNDLCEQIKREFAKLQQGQLPLHRYHLGQCNCGESWGFMAHTPPFIHHAGHKYGSGIPLSDHGAFHLARAIVDSGGYDAWTKERMDSALRWFHSRG